MADALLDNDVLHKAARYGFIASLLESIPLGINGYHMLGAAKFIIRKKLTKRPPGRGAAAAIEQFEAETGGIQELEPTLEEVRYSAALELLAQQLNVPLDAGESLLCTMLTLRGYAYLLTGDKRAIGAIEGLLEQRPDLDVPHKLVCLEQLVCWLIDHCGFDMARAAICSEPDADRALAVCFACHSPEAAPEDCRAGLTSYIGYLRGLAPRVLVAAP